jgi:hypothetical protein
MKYLVILFFLTLSVVAGAQTITTVILVRHAEKGTDDPKDS